MPQFKERLERQLVEVRYNTVLYCTDSVPPLWHSTVQNTTVVQFSFFPLSCTARRRSYRRQPQNLVPSLCACETWQEAPPTAKVKVLASGNSIERKFRYSTLQYSTVQFIVLVQCIQVGVIGGALCLS